MRNLKRVLSLTLASVMLLGMMVIGSSAAADYSDVDYAEDNVEAIEVLNAINVMTGDAGASTFRPGDPVSRGEMARIMASLLALDYEYYIGANPFTDMVGHWAEGYAAACAANGIIAGRGDGIYDPSATVTTVEAAAMLMRALGYFQNAAVDYVDGFEIATIRQAGRIDLFNKVDTKTNEPMTRNDVAQLVLNTLKSGMVEPDNGNKVSVTVGDAQVTVGATNYVYVVSRESYATAIRDDKGDNYSAGDTTGLRNAYIVDLGEKLYQGDLTRVVTNDALGRPAQHWEYKTKEIGTYADAPDYAFSAKVTSKKLYDTVGNVAAANYRWEVYSNGVLVDYNDDDAAGSSSRDLIKNRVDDDKCFLEKVSAGRSKYGTYTGNGVVTEIFVDDTYADTKYNGKVTVAVYNLYAAEVMRVIKNDGTIVLTDLDSGPATAAHEYETTLFDEDDIVVYTFSESADEIQAVALATRIDGEITRVRTGQDGGADDQETGEFFIVDGESYNYNKTVTPGNRLQTESVNNKMVGYVDEFGYCIYIDQAAVTYDYAYVLSAGTDNDRYGTDVRGRTIYARLAFTDGTTASVETDNAPGKWIDEDTDEILFEHMVVSYSVDKKGVYTLTPAYNFVYGDTSLVEAPDLEIKNNVSSFNDGKGNRYSANSNTIFVLVTTDKDSYSSYSFSSYTGVARVPDVDGVKRYDEGEYNGSYMAVATERDSRVAKAVFVLDGNISGGDVYFVRANQDAKLVRDSEIGDYYEISAYVDGEAVTLKVKTTSSAANTLVLDIDGNDESGLVLKENKDETLNQVIYAADAITENSDGLVTGVHLYGDYNDDGDGVLVGVGTDKTNRNVIVLGREEDSDKADRFTYESDAVFTQWVNRNNVSRFETSRANAIKNDANDEYIVVTDGDVITGICVWYQEGGEGEFKPGTSSDPGTPKPPAGSITITFDDEELPDASWTLRDEDGEEISKTKSFKAGDTFTVTPAEALVVSGDVTEEDGVYTVSESPKTITVKPGDDYAWMFGRWWKIDEEGKMRPQNLMIMARAASEGDWMDELIEKGEGATVKISTWVGDDEYIWTVGIDEDGLYIQAPAGITGAAMRACFKNFAGTEDEDYEIVDGEGEGGEPSETNPAEGIKATVTYTTKLEASFSAYLGDNNRQPRTLTAEEIAAALSKEKDLKNTKVNYEVKAEDVTINSDGSGTAKTSTGDTISFTSVTVNPGASNGELFKVTYPGGVVYGSSVATVKMTNVDAGVLYLMKKTDVVAAAGSVEEVDEDDHDTAAVTPSKDEEYVEALPKGAFTIGANDAGVLGDKNTATTGAVKVGYMSGATFTALDTTAFDYIQKGASLVFRSAETTNGSSGTMTAVADYGTQVVLSINGEVVHTFDVNKDKEVEEWTSDPITAVSSTTKAVEIVAEIKKLLPAVELVVGGKTVTLTAYEDTDIKVTAYGVPEGADLAWKDEDGKLTALSTSKASAEGDVEATVTLDMLVDGKITLVPVFTVTGATKVETAKKWNAFKKSGCKDEDLYSAATIVEAGGTIYVQAVTEKTIVALASATAKSTMTVVAGKEPSGATGSTQKGVWAVTVNEDLTVSTAFELAADLNETAKVDIAAAVTTSETEVTVTGLTLKHGVTVDSVSYIADSELAAAGTNVEYVAGSVKVDESTGAVTLKIKASKEIAQQSGSTDTPIGTLLITLKTGLATDPDWSTLAAVTVKGSG